VNTLKIALVGQPNVGKSSLLNALVGPRVTVSNYPGTTVELTKAEKKFNGVEINFIDTPGIYSISDQSKEEKITEKVLFEEDLDGVVVVVDALSLERGLYIVLQILEARLPTILAVNFTEEARDKGIEVNYQKLRETLGIPVIPINPIRKNGISELLKVISKVDTYSTTPFSVQYDDHIEQGINQVSSKVDTTKLPKRFIALRTLEEDKDFYSYLEDEKILDKVKENLKEHPTLNNDIAITRYGTASFLAGEVTNISPVDKTISWEDKVDSFLLHQTWGPVITLLILFGVFSVLLVLGNFTQGLLTQLGDRLLDPLSGMTSSLTTILVSRGLTGLIAGVAIALPYVFLFYLLLGFLEDIGVLSRFIVNADRFLRKLGLPGKSFIPIALGLGCTAPASRATRVLATKEEQFYASSIFAFVPCSSRIAIIMGIVGFYGNSVLALSVFVTMLAAGLVWAFGMKKLFYLESEPLLLELPPYRRPLISNIFAKSWNRMKEFVYLVMPLLALGGIVYGILDWTDLANTIVKPLTPITGWLGLPNKTIIPLVFGFLQKDLTGSMLVSVLGSKISLSLSAIQLYAFGVASTIGIPCIIAFGVLVREIGGKRTTLLTVSTITYGFLIAGILLRIARLF